ncbi:T9SS type A sorting domain-containing protein [Hymenobacter sp. ASUV-10]|uniref:T9SS type A sorting domain-containing protein n=1 Tax=Hymenobacter aranciens TaxID=3063996 RepID=A0ABT9B8B3_9BACT|nr:T9SS type A sorting domain-containing protein [Hymenobacter sp. ASUV-10]MDO7874475.1 T9SS type A sorting domain-containing protein [Hymenobacter sp. ASUV-10]
MLPVSFRASPSATRLLPTLLTGLLLGTIATSTAEAQLLAFPGAEGAGRFTTGGRGRGTAGTTVFEVTSLADTNTPGTLRYALSQSVTAVPARTVVFRVCGTIHLLTRLNIPRNTTLAGQTAPGDGICISDKQVTVNGDNVIIRFLRFRLGDRYQKLVNAAGNPVDGSGNDDALSGTDRKNLIIDHCTMSWSNDEAFTFYGAACDSMTLQWNLISEPLNYSYHFEAGDTDYERHGYGGIWGGKRASFHHNMFAHCLSRTPRWNGTRYGAAIGSENCDFRNNVIYNWGSNNVYGGEGGNYNIVNNYYKPGPSTTSNRSRIMNPYRQTTAPVLPFPKIYLTGNYVDGNATNTARNWRGVGMQGSSLADTVLSKVTTEFNIGPVVTESAQDAYNSVLAGVGCVLPARDALDRRIMDDVRNRTGAIIDVQGGYPHGTPYAQTTGAWPVLTCGTSPADTDHDGMPDAWETANGLNPNNAADRNTTAPNGYPNLENYLNGLVVIPTATRPGSKATGSLLLYPNPATEQITLAHPRAGRQARIAVYNFVGQRVLSRSAAAGSEETAFTFDNLPKGNYLVVYTDEQVTLSAKCARE